MNDDMTLEQDDDEIDDDGWCFKCDDDHGDVQLPNGDWTCWACLADLYRDLVESTPAPLAWSSEQPKVAGKYYLRVMTSEGWRVAKDFLNVTERDLKTPRFWWNDGDQAAGPIPEPVEAQ